MLKIGIIIGSTRANRVGEQVGKWAYEQASKRTDAVFELVDLKDFHLPLFDEPISPAMAHAYTHEHTCHWAEKVASLDAFIFVTPEYNHGTCAALKNALDFLYREWNDKVAGFVAYGSAGGARAVEQLRLNLAELQVATVRAQVALFLRSDFENYTNFKPAAYHEKTLNLVLDQVIKWGEALKSTRTSIRSGELPQRKELGGEGTSLH